LATKIESKNEKNQQRRLSDNLKMTYRGWQFSAQQIEQKMLKDFRIEFRIFR